MSEDSGLPTLEAGSSSDCTSVTSLEQESHPSPPTPGLSQHGALEHLSRIISSQHDWHVTARPATEPWMHLSAVKAFSLQPALATSGNHPESVSNPEPNIYSLTSSLCTTYELGSISGLYNLFQETAWMGKGPDLSHASPFDIVMDESLNT